MRSSDVFQSTALDGIAARAQKEKTRRFDNLFSLLSVSLLRWSYYQLRPRASAGVDHVTWHDYGADLESNLRDLHQRLLNQRYRAPMVRRTYIPKSNGKMRPLGIPCLEDKIVQRSVTEILQSIFNSDFTRSSYGYRPGVGAQDAVRDLGSELHFGIYGYVVEADIKGFFDHMDHAWLIRMLEQRVHDRRLISLIRKWLKAGVLEPEGQVVHPVTGTPQGGIISPLLANIYLHYALDLWFEKVVKRRFKGRCFLLRYADDFVMGFQYQHEAKQCYRDLPDRLGKFNLSIEPSKTALHSISRYMNDPRASFDFLGFTYRWQYDRKGKPLMSCTTSRKSFNASLRTLKEWVKASRDWKPKFFFARLRQKLRGYRNYYGIRGNVRCLVRMWYQVFKLVHKWLNRRSQRRSYSQSGLTMAMAYYDLPKPHILSSQPRRPLPKLWELT